MSASVRLMKSRSSGEVAADTLIVRAWPSSLEDRRLWKITKGVRPDQVATKRPAIGNERGEDISGENESGVALKWKHI